MVYPDVTEAELAVLQVLWEHGSSTLRHLAQSIYPNKALANAQATIAKLMERLEAKQCIARERGEGPQRFRAIVDRDALIGRKLQSLANQLCEGSLTPLLTNLVKAGSLSARERRQLAQLLNDIHKPTT
ncbi:MAG TPA: BlaI/MecI/CopY family transcriptional regulator [Gemmatales bacterium]|nr:BlaI/MecI/CopY family transcriptional regulator [Gemmatales bacterium]HMP18464.1 BlaI/MecI/CopY family transcriptional regulator [Gemmatales bacterium]